MNIIHTPHEVLTTPAATVGRIDKKIHTLISEMKKALVAHKDPEGVGLAATQVGVAKRIFIMMPTKQAPIEVFINPEIVEQSEISHVSKSKETRLEGCLSIPRLWGPVRRSEKVRLVWQDEHGMQREEWFSGFKAIIIQHEVDHLNGILFTQRIMEQHGRLYIEKDGELEEYKI
ncbi:MAG: Peptide deformylase [Microgenomates bacterium OLB22]|nr:MAG: Peptide deformylase [Microgenomates bacterium OLB22]